MPIRANMSGAIAKLRRLSANLARVRDGNVCEETAQIIGDEAGEEIVVALGPHRRSGASADAMLIQPSAKGVRVSAAYYLKFHPWWPFGDGFPAKYVPRAVEVFHQRVRAALGGG